MKDCLIYIFIIFIISFFLSMVIKSDLKEGLNNKILEKITFDDIQKDMNPSLAGSIDIPNETKNESSYKIFNDEDIFFNMMKRNRNFQDYKKPDKSSNEINYGKFYDEKYSDYSPYETIIGPMKKSMIRDLTNVPLVQRDSRFDLSDNSESIYGLDGLDPTKDCQGKWEPWDESNCPDSRDRCTLKSRVYKILKAKQDGGKDCSYEGDVIEDGDIEYDYCFGSGHKDRCGLDRNLCDCDLDNYDEDECNIETLNEECRCPAGYSLSDEGKCEDTSQNNANIPGQTGTTSTGTNQVQIVNNNNNNPLELVSLLRFAFAEGEIQRAKRIEESISGSGITPERRQQYLDANNTMFEEILEQFNTKRGNVTLQEYQQAIIDSELETRFKVILNDAEPNTCHINPFNKNYEENAASEINDLCENSSGVKCDFNCNPYINKPICCMKPNELNVSKDRFNYINDLNAIEMLENEENNNRFNIIKQDLINSTDNKCHVNIYKDSNISSINSFIDMDTSCKQTITECDLCNSSNTVSNCCKIPV